MKDIIVLLWLFPCLVYGEASLELRVPASTASQHLRQPGQHSIAASPPARPAQPRRISASQVYSITASQATASPLTRPQHHHQPRPSHHSTTIPAEHSTQTSQTRTTQKPGKPLPTSRPVVTKEEIQSLAEYLYIADINKADSDDIILNLQHKASTSEMGSGTDFSSQKFFSYVNESKLFTRPTFARLISMLDNYFERTGTEESETSDEIREQAAFLEAIFQTAVISNLSSFLITKGYYNSSESFERDLRDMWFGMYTRTRGSLDSSGFEHVFHGEIHKRKISGFHNWVQLYMLEKF
ncbi:uridylate-specific endoribonuclease D-like [Hyperolius riggenbachi]|uniref:uridylate-specific endoribonuclease D-like n=1 Tax=Hyperolius riggenbachi TaxID=752182 RepID=UPI0035A30738